MEHHATPPTVEEDTESGGKKGGVNYMPEVEVSSSVVETCSTGHQYVEEFAVTALS